MKQPFVVLFYLLTIIGAFFLFVVKLPGSTAVGWGILLCAVANLLSFDIKVKRIFLGSIPRISSLFISEPQPKNGKVIVMPIRRASENSKKPDGANASRPSAKVISF